MPTSCTRKVACITKEVSDATTYRMLLSRISSDHHKHLDNVQVQQRSENRPRTPLPHPLVVPFVQHVVKEGLPLSLQKLEIKFNSCQEHTVKNLYIIYLRLCQPMPWLQKFRENARDKR
jgi:hypothetical protein